MLRVVIKIMFEQQPSVAFPKRTRKFTSPSCVSFECSDSWENLTNKGKVTLPRSMTLRDENNKVFNLAGNYKNIGGFIQNAEPVFLRGDKVSIYAGYTYKNDKGNDVTETYLLFKGWITKIGSHIPIELECEDNMWKLKQLALPNNPKPSWSSYGTLENMLKAMLQTPLPDGTKLPFAVSITTQTSFGDFTTRNETMAQVLARLRKEYLFESYFRLVETPLGSGNYVDTLFAGSLVYSGLTNIQTQNFSFQQTIISDELDFSRKDDITLSAIASNMIETQNGYTKDGQPKTKKTRLEVMVVYQNGSTTAQVFTKLPGKDWPINVEGERRSFTYKGLTTINQLAAAAKADLIKYYYTGLKGNFTTFGLPFVRMGDQVQLSDNVQKEREGLYKVKAVEYSFGVSEGLRQKIHLHYRIPLQEVL